MNGESVRIWKEEEVAHFKVINMYLPRKVEGNHCKPQNKGLQADI
jgi:hypothetical protein